jgi:urease accessory protein
MAHARWRILQLADSGFPTGGFAHSAGLEAAMHCGEVATAERLAAYVHAYLWNVGNAVLPFVAAAHDRPQDVQRVDAQVDAFLTNHVANRASRTQGRAFVTTCARVFDTPAITELAGRARAGEAASHLAAMFGAVLAALAVERHETLAIHLYLALRGMVSAAVRLGIVGPYEAQRMHGRHWETLDSVLARCSAMTPADAATVAPVLDVVGATHDGLYSRLFQS